MRKISIFLFFVINICIKFAFKLFKIRLKLNMQIFPEDKIKHIEYKRRCIKAPQLFFFLPSIRTELISMFRVYIFFSFAYYTFKMPNVNEYYFQELVIIKIKLFVQKFKRFLKYAYSLYLYFREIKYDCFYLFFKPYVKTYFK